MKSDRYYDPPDVCKTCGIYHAYRNGQCYECYAASESDHSDQKREERMIEELERRARCEG